MPDRTSVDSVSRLGSLARSQEPLWDLSRIDSQISEGVSPPPEPRVVVMIPSLNEEKTIGSVVQRVPRDVAGVLNIRVLVIDDGSGDETPLMARQAGADEILRHKRTQGLGCTFRDGLAAGLEMGADIIVNIDADGQYDPGEIPLLLEPILRGRADITLGNRGIKELTHMPWSRKWGNRAASWITRRLSGLGIQDSQTGFRALTRGAALRLTLDGGFTYTQEMIIQAAHRGLSITEVPVTFDRRSEGDSRLIRSMWGYAIRSGGIVFRSYRDYNPLKTFALIGLLVLAVGGILGFRIIVHYLLTGTVSPLIPSALLAAILGIIGFQVIVFGLVADMLKTQRRLSEEILLRLRRSGGRTD